MAKNVKVIPWRGKLETLPGHTTLLIAFALAFFFMPWVLRRKIHSSEGRPLRKPAAIPKSPSRHYNRAASIKIRNWRFKL